MVKVHGSSRGALDRVMQRAAMGPSKLIPNPGRLAEKAFLALYHDKIQTLDHASNASYWDNDDNPHEFTALGGALWIPSHDLLIQGIRVKTTWWDQGWGNQKGKLYVALQRRTPVPTRSGTDGVAEVPVSPPEASSSWTYVEETLVDLFRHFADHSPR